MRRWVIVGGLFALVAASVVGVYMWYRHEDSIERAVHAHLKTTVLQADWVSCHEDHSYRAGGSLITFYRCDVHGGSAGAVCTPFINGRVINEAEARRIPLEKAFCRGFG
jgi:hypothetical protein